MLAKNQIFVTALGPIRLPLQTDPISQSMPLE